MSMQHICNPMIGRYNMTGYTSAMFTSYRIHIIHSTCPEGSPLSLLSFNLLSISHNNQAMMKDVAYFSLLTCKEDIKLSEHKVQTCKQPMAWLQNNNYFKTQLSRYELISLMQIVISRSRADNSQHELTDLDLHCWLVNLLPIQYNHKCASAMLQ